MEKRDRLDALMTLRGYTTKRKFAEKLGIRENVLCNWYARNTYDIEAVSKAFPEVSPDWLITGRGPMLRSSDTEVATLEEEIRVLKERLDALMGK